MDIVEFDKKVEELIIRFDNEKVPPPFRVGHMKKSDTTFEIAVVDPFGQPVEIFTVYLDQRTNEVCYCHGQQFKSPEKVIN